MRIRKEDAGGDMMFGHGEGDFYRDDPKGVGQLARNRLMLWQGEWFLDISDGTQYQSQVLGKGKETLYADALRARLITTTGVTGIDRLERLPDNRPKQLSVSVALKTAYGQTTLTIPLIYTPATG